MIGAEPDDIPSDAVLIDEFGVSVNAKAVDIMLVAEQHRRARSKPSSLKARRLSIGANADDTSAIESWIDPHVQAILREALITETSASFDGRLPALPIGATSERWADTPIVGRQARLCRRPNCTLLRTVLKLLHRCSFALAAPQRLCRRPRTTL